MLAPRLARGSPSLISCVKQAHQVATAARMDTKPFVWSPNFIPVEFNDGVDFQESASFRLVSYNILAQVYVKSSTFPHSPSPCLKWKKRSQEVLSRLLALDADFLCIQELDEFESFYRPHLESKGYDNVYIQRAGKKRDGCGIFYRHQWCELLEKRFIDYNDLVPPGNESKVVDEDDKNVDDPYVRFRRNCVGILTAFRLTRAPNNIIVLANTHLYWDPELQDVKLAQAKYLLAKLCEFEKEVYDKFNIKPVVLVAGDFNSTPGDPVYNYMISGLRNKSLESSFNLLDLKELKTPAIPLDSLYATVQGEPTFTNCTPGFTGTLDYIFFCPSNILRPKAFLELSRPDAPDVLGGLPNHAHPSDHLPIGADFSIY